MLKIVTESGAEYLLDTSKFRLKRTEGSTPVTNSRHANEVWHDIRQYEDPIVGKPWRIVFDDYICRVTTPVVSMVRA